MRTRMSRKRFLGCLARTVSIEGRGQKAVFGDNMGWKARRTITDSYCKQGI